MCSSFMESPLSPVVPCIDYSPYSNIYGDSVVSSFFLFFASEFIIIFFLFSHGGISRETGELPSGPTYTANLLLSVLSARFLLLLFSE